MSWRAVLYRVSERLPKEERRRLWRRMNIEYQRRYGRRLLELTEPSGVGEDAFRARWPIARAGAEPARLDARDFQGDRLARLVREGVERDAIPLSRAAEILGLTLDEMRDRSASWVG